MRSLAEIIKEVESIKQDLNSTDMVMLLSSADSIAHMRIAAERITKAIEHLKDVAECIDVIGQLLPIEKPVLE